MNAKFSMPHVPSEILLGAVEEYLGRHGPSDTGLRAILDQVLDHFSCAVGTIHTMNPASGRLQLRVHRGLPEVLRSRVQDIPIGKGMAGLAAERRQPVQVCNLQTDESGKAKPAARETKMEGSIAVPLLSEEQVCGVLGVAKPVEYEFQPTEIDLLLQVGKIVARHVASATT